MPTPTTLVRISRDRFRRGSRNFTNLSETASLINQPDMTSLSASGRLQNPIEYCITVSSSENDCLADDAVEEAEETDIPLSSVCIGGRPLCNLQFADDIDLLGSSQEELQQLTQILEEIAAEYGTEISSDKSKILVSSIK